MVFCNKGPCIKLKLYYNLELFVIAEFKTNNKHNNNINVNEIRNQ